MSRVLPDQPPSGLNGRLVPPANDLSRYVLFLFIFLILISLHYFHQNVPLLLINVVCACFFLFFVLVHPSLAFVHTSETPHYTSYPVQNMF